jgi:DNA polymerase III delta prime subunit
VLTALRHVLWIGGPPGVGKTTTALRIARRHGLRWYGADTRTWEHRYRALRARNRAAHRWEAMAPEQRTAAPPGDLLAMSLHFERGPMIVDDLRRLPRSPLIVAEGTPVSPSLVRSGVAEAGRAVWLAGTRHARGPVAAVVAEAIVREVAENQVPVLEIDGSRDVDDVVAAVERHFAEALAKGPRAEAADERRALLRDANEAIVAQCLGYLARPWSTGGPKSLVRGFVCECDDPGCDAVVEAPISVAAAAPVFAPGHSCNAEDVRRRGDRQD